MLKCLKANNPSTYIHLRQTFYTVTGKHMVDKKVDLSVKYATFKALKKRTVYMTE